MKNKIFLSFLGALVLTLGISGILGYLSFQNQPKPVFGAASLEGTYQYKNITASNASSTAAVGVRGGAGVLGYLTIASSSAAFTAGGQGIRVYDGTSSTTGTLIATIKSNASEGTYLFEVAVNTGIALDVPVGFTGSYTFSFK